MEELQTKALIESFAQDETMRAHLARAVAEKARALFADPVIIGVALAAGQRNTERFARFVPSHLSGGGTPKFVLREAGGEQEAADICPYRLDERGLTPTPDASHVTSGPIHISMEQIDRCQRLALEFRLPESIGLRWWHMRRPFGPDAFQLCELPRWEPGKFWLRWMEPDWAAKGSPEKSTFLCADPGRPESLSLQELARLASEAGTPAWRTE
ncbi:hypothetical protein R3X27_05290 [Tropicimonas sp. TH_r6]|uniref:hypothetical protein n=1 Tax=Tropicimonas sp. TH_r6 TaxID=3082085 RepID=UPI0029534FA0|nr:hypothetical protein [Tropicimonas sp. TH_r6]MDV7142091.1 hypothetical protein [Tropicimonas sp. TH_r6]